MPLNTGLLRKRIKVFMEQVTHKQDSPCHADDEIDLVDLFLVIWKRKWMIVCVTLCLTFAGFAISMILPKIYVVTAILEPAKDEKGHLVRKPQVIRENINSGAFDQEIWEKFSLDLDEMPKFKVSAPKGAGLVKISIESQEPEVAVQVLRDLLSKISKNIEKQFEIRKKIIDNRLSTAIKRSKLLQLQVSQLESFISITKKKISDLEAARNQAIPGQKSDAIAVLLYLTQIQGYQFSLNDLYLKINELKTAENKTVSSINELQLTILAIKGTIVSKYPKVPEKPIKPKRTLIVALAFVLGLMGGIMLAFLAEFVTKARLR